MNKSGFFIVKFLKTLSIIGLIIMLLYAYNYLPEKVTVHFNASDIADQFVSKTGFFYGIGIIAVVFYAFAGILGKMVSSVDIRYFYIPNKTFWEGHGEAKMFFYKIFSEWLNSLSLLVNIFLIICIIVMIKAHSAASMSAHDFKFLPWIGGILFLIWVIFLPLRLQIKKYSLLG